MERGVEMGTEEKARGMSKTGEEASGTRKAGEAWTEEWDGLNGHQKSKSTITTHTKPTLPSPQKRQKDRQTELGSSREK